MKKKQYIETLSGGDTVESYFVITKAEKKQAKNDRPFWDIVLQDKTGTISAKIWSPLSETIETIEEKVFVEIIGAVQEYKNQPQITVREMNVLTEQELLALDMSNFIPCSERKPEEMWKELLAICTEIFTHKPWLTFTISCLNSERVRNGLMYSPAAKSMHHAYRSGLLEHLLSVVHLCIVLGKQYPQLDMQVLVAGGLFHDIGKIVEMQSDISTEYTTEGQLLGHITQGIELVTPFMQEAHLEPELQLQLKHIILSHHGYEEFGSPKRPQTAEALIVHYADNIDAKLEMFRGIFKNAQEDTEVWSGRQWGFNNMPVFSPLSTQYFEKNIQKEPASSVLAIPQQCTLL